MKHKWHKEIIHWANGGEIESRSRVDYALYQEDWSLDKEPFWYEDELEFRIKPQPKEPQYLYIWDNGFEKAFTINKCGALIKTNNPIKPYTYIGKIKLEQDDV